MRKNNKLLAAVFIFIFVPLLSYSQSAITFRLDMSSKIKDGTFLPSKHEVSVTGNQLPFSATRTIKLKDTAPKDSIYSAKVQFPSIVNGKELNYHFIIRRDYKKFEERNTRSLLLDHEDKILPTVKFDQFAG